VNVRNALVFAGYTFLVPLVACTVGDESQDPAGAAPVIGDPNPNGKPPGEACGGNDECRTGVCKGGTCQAASNTDGVKNGDESDVDCGGAQGPGCGVGKACATDANCASRRCVDYRCADANGGGGGGGGSAEEEPPPRYDDGIKNGTETDVDCGGPGPGPRCDVGKTCKEHSDCVTGGCTFEGKCALRPSCTALEGGFTCGPNEGMTKQNDCCESAMVGPYEIDKYLITAGRMRAFLTRLDGKVRDWAATLPADKWNQAWTPKLPNSIAGTPGSPDNANTQLGPFYNKRSCETGYHTGHTFWTPEEYGDKKDLPQNVLDTKALNCVPWHLLAALCVFDGGHLATEAELVAAYTNNKTTQYPWGARGSYTTGGQNPFAIQQYSYVTPGSENARRNAQGFLDAAVYIAPPGRAPQGYNQTGHADLVGNLLEWVGDNEGQFIWNGSFERHAAEADRYTSANNDPLLTRQPGNNRIWKWAEVARTDGMVNGYYAIGGRCAY